MTHAACKGKFRRIFDLAAGVYFDFHNILTCVCRGWRKSYIRRKQVNMKSDSVRTSQVHTGTAFQDSQLKPTTPHATEEPKTMHKSEEKKRKENEINRKRSKEVNAYRYLVCRKRIYPCWTYVFGTKCWGFSVWFAVGRAIYVIAAPFRDSLPPYTARIFVRRQPTIQQLFEAYATKNGRWANL